ncbi:MAG: hypothetical protein MK202_05895 [Tenacibaculum sp.]|nr:hypothetical protein [Tenacibaculum sp.]
MEPKKQEDFNLTSNLNLEDSTNYQLLLASQNYNTFYCIYGKLEINQKSNTLEGIDLKILNYKGAFNIGFIGDSSMNNFIKVRREKTSLLISIPVNGFSAIQSTSTDKNNFDNNQPVDLTGITNVRVFRGLIKNDQMTDRVWDSEFRYRDGRNRRDRSVQSLPEGLYSSIDDWKKSNFDYFNEDKASGDNCFTSYLNTYPN